MTVIMLDVYFLIVFVFGPFRNILFSVIPFTKIPVSESTQSMSVMELIMLSLMLVTSIFILVTKPFKSYSKPSARAFRNESKKLVAQTQTVSKRQESMLYMVTMLTKLSNAEFEVLLEMYKGLKYKKVTIVTVVSLRYTPIGRLFCY
ncbi:MAG: hypothetical protein SOS24_10560 [Clostridia bacterium]|nr:hypothetical protein [Clostridia bacterium]